MPDHSFIADRHTIRNVRRDFPEWHRGRPLYLLWALDLDVPSVEQRLQAAREHLAGLLLGDYRRQAHVTLSLCGFPSRSPRLPDDFSEETLRTQIDRLEAARPGAFEVEIGALASFSSAPYLTVNESDHGGHIARLRRCLEMGDINAQKGRYTPHVTVGLYADAWPTAAVQRRLSAFACDKRLPLQVRSVSLMSYAASDIGGELRRLAEVDLATGRTCWLGTPWPDADRRNAPRPE